MLKQVFDGLLILLVHTKQIPRKRELTLGKAACRYTSLAEGGASAPAQTARIESGEFLDSVRFR
jgi:hypothetical protein